MVPNTSVSMQTTATRHTDREFISSFGASEFEGRFHNADVYGNVSVGSYVKVLAGINYQDF